MIRAGADRLEQLLEPFEPTAGLPFDTRRAAHLIRRSGFGASPAEVARAVDDGIEKTLDRLLDRRPGTTAELDDLADTVAAGDIEGLQAWWVARMIRTGDPLTEKVALFWHGHFATSDAKVNDTRLMLGQLRIFLDLGRSNFLDLLSAVSDDPAMLLWLDSDRNQKLHPNENFARELFELFTLGIGNYSEKDVQEAARALTGWRRAAGSFRYIEARHDPGEKEVLGQRGKFDRHDIYRICVEQPATARYLVRGMMRFFVQPEPPEELVHLLGDRFARHELNVDWLLNELFRSRLFFSDEALEARIQSPVEFVVGTLRTLEVRANAKRAAREIAAMGQNLLRPPSVKGWDGEQAWIHAGSMIARLNFAARIARGKEGKLALDLTPERLAKAPDEPLALARYVADRLLLHRPLDETVIEAVAEHITLNDERVPRLSAAVRGVLSLPEASIG